MALRLPSPMLARSGALPTGAGWRFEPKLDGFRCLVCTHGSFCAKSRRGWNMTELLPELAGDVLRDVQLDAELVAFDQDGRPSFDLLSRRMLHGDRSVRVTLMVFDVLAVEGLPTVSQPYSERRALIEDLDLEATNVRVVPSFEDGQALWGSVVDFELEGVVAKKVNERYKPGERTWLKKKNRAWSRYEAEREGAIRAHRR